MQIPEPLQRLFSHFPLHTHPPVANYSTGVLQEPTIWVHPPSTDAVLSSDVECLKWQAYIALRLGPVSKIKVRFDVDAQGAIDGRLPNLHIPFEEEKVYSWSKTNTDNGLLSAPQIVEWADVTLAHSAMDDEWEGYRDEASKDESRAWVSLLEGNVHAALILSQPAKGLLSSLLSFSSPTSSANLESILVPPPPPSTGLFSLLPSYKFTVFSPFGNSESNETSTRVNITPATRQAVFEKYAEAIKALSEKLGTDKWFLGSEYPTPLDALMFAYLHCILQSSELVRMEVTRRVNLVAWEWRVRAMVKAAFVRA